MVDSIFFYVLVMLGSVFVASVSQVLLKKEAMESHDSAVREYFNRRVVLAYGLFLVSMFLTMYSYKGIPLSLGPILEATGYFYVALFGVVLFHERISVRKMIALLLIVVGIAVYALFA
ncbi:multidrug ABC transporter [Gordonibacter sp. An232A]|nr:multidrug ABC transporter [Gordonibacter sp. An232A]